MPQNPLEYLSVLDRYLCPEVLVAVLESVRSLKLYWDGVTNALPVYSHLVLL
jgi:hypothetical protein